MWLLSLTFHDLVVVHLYLYHFTMYTEKCLCITLCMNTCKLNHMTIYLQSRLVANLDHPFMLTRPKGSHKLMPYLDIHCLSSVSFLIFYISSKNLISNLNWSWPESSFRCRLVKLCLMTNNMHGCWYYK